MRLIYWKLLFILNGLIPFGFLISLMTFYFHAAKILGRFPSYNLPDPKELDIYTNYSKLIYAFGNVWIYSFLAMLIMIVVFVPFQRRQTNWKLIGIGSLGHILAVILFVSGIMEWYAD